MKRFLAVFVVGITLFSMFFGGGNLVFPLLMGINATSPILSTVGFLLSSVLLPFVGICIGIYFKGDYEKCLSVFGKTIGYLLIFFLLLCWIPLGSGPRCNQLAYGAFCEIGGSMPLWLFSAIYSGIVYLLTVKKNYFIEILGKVVTPLLIFFLFFLIFSLFTQTTEKPFLGGELHWKEFYHSVVAGYNTMDFIASIFFSSAIIALLKEKHKDKFKFTFVRNACILAVSLLTLVYLGMFSIGYVNADVLQGVSGSRLLASVSHVMFGEKLKVIVFMIITLSVLSTSMALVLVFSDYLTKIIFKGKISHKTSLLISVVFIFIISTVGFEKLSVFISYAMSTLYPFLLITTVAALGKNLLSKKNADVLQSDCMTEKQVS